MEPTLEVRVEGEAGSIPVRAFLEVLRTSLDILNHLERAEPVPSRLPGTWLIADLHTSSAVATLRRPDAPHLRTHLRLVEGIGQLRESQELPPYFSSHIAEAVVKIGKQARQPGVSGVSFQLPRTPEFEPRLEQVSEVVVQNAQASVEGSERVLGSVAGVLDVINLRRGAHVVSLYDEKSRRAVRCTFPSSHFDTMKEALGHRIRALGEVTRNRCGQALRVTIEHVELLPDEPGAPSVDDLVGVAPWYTGEQSTEQYLRSVRGA